MGKLTINDHVQQLYLVNSPEDIPIRNQHSETMLRKPFPAPGGSQSQLEQMLLELRRHRNWMPRNRRKAQPSRRSAGRGGARGWCFGGKATFFQAKPSDCYHCFRPPKEFLAKSLLIEVQSDYGL